MARTYSATAFILTALLVTPLAAPLCAAGLCDPDVPCRMLMQEDGPDGLRLVDPSCCLSLSASIADRASATPVAPSSPDLAASTPLAGILVAMPSPQRSVALAPAPSHSGRTALALHRTLLL